MLLLGRPPLPLGGEQGSRLVRDVLSQRGHQVGVLPAVTFLSNQNKKYSVSGKTRNAPFIKKNSVASPDLMLPATPSSSTVSYCHFLFCLHSPPHFADLHLGQGQWQPAQGGDRQSHRSRRLLSSRPRWSYTLFLLRPEQRREHDMLGPRGFLCTQHHMPVYQFSTFSLVK